jgi:hypothetical protein
VEEFKHDATAGRIKATALVYDMLVVPPGTSIESNAIAVALDHRDHYSVIVIFPYVLNHGNLAVGAPFAQKGELRIFPLESVN